MNSKREIIHSIARHSNWKEQDVAQKLEKDIYTSIDDGKKFFSISLLVAGIGFFLVGAVFFFAYNWDSISTIAKFGIIQGLLAISVLISILQWDKNYIRQIGLFSASLLTGILLAVFGQTYQSGADAFGLFLTWAILIIPWVLIAKSPPLWAGFIVLINTALALYLDQEHLELGHDYLLLISFLFNLSIFIFLVVLKHRKLLKIPNWLLHTLLLFCIFMATFGFISFIYDKFTTAKGILLIVLILSYIAGFFWGYKKKDLLIIGSLYFSSIVILSALAGRHAEGLAILLLMGLIFIIGTTLVVLHIIDLQKQKDE